MEQQWKSSVLNTFNDPEHCKVCAFVDGDREYETLMEVIRILDLALAEKSQRIDELVNLLVNSREDGWEEPSLN